MPKPPDVYAVTLRFGDSSLAERNQSRRLRAQAESQIKLLTEAEGIFEGDFYSYRYFAAEGFLPGNSFPRRLYPPTCQEDGSAGAAKLLGLGEGRSEACRSLLSQMKDIWL